MSHILKNFSIKDCELVNFWDVNDNNQLLAIQPFRDIYESDKTKSKKDSSRLMWAIALIWDYESRLYKASEADRIDAIEKDFLMDPGFFEREQEKINPVIEQYNALQQDSVYRMLRTQEKKLDERNQFMEDQAYTLATAKTLDNMAKDTKNILSTMDLLKKEIEKKQGDSKIKGDHKPSMLEEGGFE